MERTDDHESKEQVVDQVPKRISALQFGLLTPQDTLSQSVLAVTDRNVYDVNVQAGQKRLLTKNGPNDERLGTSSKSVPCATCGEGLKDCNGHFGHVRLALPLFHYGYMRKITEVLGAVCKECSRLLLPEEERRAALRQVRRPGIDTLRRTALCKKIAADCKKVKVCPECRAFNGQIKKVPTQPVKLIHNKFAIYTNSHAKNKQKPQELVDFEESFELARKNNPEVDRHMKKVSDDMNPIRVYKIFKKIPAIDVELLGMDPHNGGRPEHLIWTHIPAPPVAIRPSVAQDQASTEDDLTNKLADIISVNGVLKACLAKGQPIAKVMEIWEFLQIQTAMYIDGNLPGLGKDSQHGKAMRGFCQRLKGKQGRFRGNLSGKRVDFSARTVISPDPNLSIDEVAVPLKVAVHMTYPERVNRYNIEKLRARVKNGDKIHPGANFIVKGRDGRRMVLKVVDRKGDLAKIASKLEIGDTVERHLEDGDIVLFNRQPSLHKLSILSHRVKVRPWRTFRLNECVCNPYNADFDGDEMNLHVPQTEEARTEALVLMGVKHNLATPKNGTPIIAAIQDFITGAYLISQKDRFFNRREFMQVISHMFDGLSVKEPVTGQRLPIQIPHPTICKPQRLWTGKQVWNVLMKPHPSYDVNVNLEAKGKTFVAPKPLPPQRLYKTPEQKAYDLKKAQQAIAERNVRHRETGEPLEVEALATCDQYRRAIATGTDGQIVEVVLPIGSGGQPADDMSPNDSYVVIRNSEVMTGALDKAIIGDGKKDSIFYVIMRDYGPDYAVAAMNRLAKLSSRWLSEQGFSIGIGDVYPSLQLREKKDALVKEAYKQCVELIALFNKGELVRSAGCDEEQTLEQKISGILSAVRQACGEACFAELSRFNAPLTMAKCGSKGSNINVSQMVAAVGQQIIGGERVVDGFENRSLPHFPKASRDPPAKGFVVNSFFSGLNPTEFIFHAMSGREGLVDTAVKTAETGYMSRRLMKSLEDLSAQNDQTVRNSSGGVIQMKFGDDGLDPLNMEGLAKPVNFERTYMHAVSVTWDSAEKGLSPEAIKNIVRAKLEKEEAKLVRRDTHGNVLPYLNPRDEDVDQVESVRVFLATIEHFVHGCIARLVDTRNHLRATDTVFKLTGSALNKFLDLCLHKFEKSKVEAGHAVGAVGAQSIGEPGTQMTLKTFHFAGVAGMSITQGVPRIKEIINASKNISTPVMTCVLLNPTEELAAQAAKALIQKTYLRDIVCYIEDAWYEGGSNINMRIDWQTVERLGLRLSVSEIVKAIRTSKLFRGITINASAAPGGNHLRVYVSPPSNRGRSKAARKAAEEFADSPSAQTFILTQTVKRQLPNVVVKGHPGAVRTVIQKGDKKDATTQKESMKVFVEGTGLRACMNTPGIDGQRTLSNNVMEVYAVLGIEAARASIIAEISACMKGMDIDPRHMQLLADIMTYKGEVLGITRFGLAKMRDSVLQLASFEKTPDHLFDAAVGGKRDDVQGVSECIVLGQTVGVGTGSMNVVRPMGDIGRWRFGGQQVGAAAREARVGWGPEMASLWAEDVDVP